MKKYTVITEIEFQYETMEVEIEVEAYTEEEAHTIAETKVFDNIFVIVHDVKNTNKESKEDEVSEYLVSISIECNDKVLNDITILEDSNSEEEASVSVKEKTLKDIVITTRNTLVNNED